MSVESKRVVPRIKYIISGDTSLGAAGTTSIQIGGADIYAPNGTDTLLGIWAHFSGVVQTDGENQTAWGYLDSEDGMNLKPFEFLYPPVGCCGGAGPTSSQTNATKGIYYPVNCPTTPGSRIAAYGQLLTACTAAPYAGITWVFSNYQAAGASAAAPRVWVDGDKDMIHDSYPGVHRWRKLSHALTAKKASGFSPEAQIQFSLGEAGGVVTEVLGCMTLATQTVNQPGAALFQITSNDVPVSPFEFFADAYGSPLGVESAHDGRNIVTRRPVWGEAEKVVHMQGAAASGAGLTDTNGVFLTGVEFIRY